MSATFTLSQPANLEAAAFSHMLSSVLTAVSPDPLGTAEHHQAQRDAAAATLSELRPRGAVQQMLAARTVAAHFAAMDSFRRAGVPGTADHVAARQRRIAFSMSRLADETQRSLVAQQLMLKRPLRSGKAVTTGDIVAAARAHARNAEPAQARRTDAAQVSAEAASPNVPAAPPIRDTAQPSGFSDTTPCTRTKPHPATAAGHLPPELAAYVGVLRPGQPATLADLAAATRASLLASASHPALIKTTG